MSSNTNNICKKTLFTAIFFVLVFVSQSTVAAFPGFFRKKEGQNCARVPILMYHEIASKQKISNRWTVTPEEFEEDLNYIQQNGYETVVMGDLIEFVNGNGELPKKPIVLTFDDGLAGVYEYAYPMLRKYNMKAVLSVIGETTDEYSKGGAQDKNRYPHLTWTQIKEMVKSGCIELQSHSYSMHKSIGAKKHKKESMEDYKERLSKDLMGLQTRITEMTEVQATTFAYPFGEYSEETKDILNELGFSASLGCYDIVNKVTKGDPSCLYNLGRTLRTPGGSSKKFFNKFQKAFDEYEKEAATETEKVNEESKLKDEDNTKDKDKPNTRDNSINPKDGKNIKDLNKDMGKERDGKEEKKENGGKKKNSDKKKGDRSKLKDDNKKKDEKNKF